HQDLLFHVAEEEFDHPYFYGVLLEATLLQGGPWTETERIVAGAIRHLNDYVGYRPLAVLENDQKTEVYSHERFRPIPLFIAGAGVGAGRYEDLLQQTFEFLRQAPDDLLYDAYFDQDRLEELAIDLRAYDHLHPVNKRTNYLFGEWDPHRIDNQGYYRRFIIRKIILDSLQDWIEDKSVRIPKAEKLFDAAAALCGTMVMASSISGAGPSTHDSTISLTSLLPIVARRRDEFYARVMESVSGDRRARLLKEQEKTQQPFGHIRQYLNMKLAGYGARQVQHRELAHLYAMLGYQGASREQALSIPAASTRIETEIECVLSGVHQALREGDVSAAFDELKVVPQLLKRGIECGALVDPWNMLGFQGQFPLFTSREDSIPDNRVETLLSLMEQIFTAFSRTLGDAAAKGLPALREQISVLHQNVAEWWDRYGSDVIADLPDVSGQESWESATHVSSVLTEWQQAGEAAGDIGFWREHVERFQSAQSYALVVDALLRRGDEVAAMGLLMQWASQLDEVGFECPHHSIFSQLIRWMKLVAGRELPPEDVGTLLGQIRRMFDFLEANAEEWWRVPNYGRVVDSAKSLPSDELEFGESEEGGFEEPDEEEEDAVFGAAYDGVVFRDSADDGNWGEMVDGNSPFSNTEFEAINRQLEPRLKFLNAVGQLWQMAAAKFAAEMYRGVDDWMSDDHIIGALSGWHRQAQRWQIDLAELMESVWDHEISESSGDHDSNVEYDIQLQVKYYVLHQVISTLICLRNAERLLNGIIPEHVDIPRGTEQDRQLARLYRSVIQRDVEQVRGLMPQMLSRLSRNPLLYIPLENGGEPGQILRIQALQSIVRFLLRELPRLGLLRETWHVLLTAYRMERKWRPRGQAITEFDRLFSIALRSTLDALVVSAKRWNGDKEIAAEDLIEAIGQVLDPYQWLWAEHSRTMRISAVDAIRRESEWQDIRDFVEKYGGDFFNANNLTLGNVRAILHSGVDWFLDYLEVESDPLHPIKLLDDIDAGIVDREEAEWALEQVYSIVVDRFDRFLEYNTTTTQSDYGEMIYCLLDFLRLEAAYDRDAWNLTPLVLVHEVLVRNGMMEGAEVWESTFEMQTADVADQHLKDLRRLQKKYGMRMPTIVDQFNERFVKPLAVNRILALVHQAAEDARAGSHEDSPAFHNLHEQVDDYLEDSWGSGVDLPEWLRLLEKEVVDAIQPEEGGRPGTEAELEILPVPVSKAQFRDQVRIWRSSLSAKDKDADTGPVDGAGSTEA
ncbi:MAG: hypothetical protein KDA80_20565, partial [Planctomycetaceae bacterium]|nr:hypothetical protein [Planctomycetaceae bacterium]